MDRRTIGEYGEPAAAGVVPGPLVRPGVEREPVYREPGDHGGGCDGGEPASQFDGAERATLSTDGELQGDVEHARGDDRRGPVADARLGGLAGGSVVCVSVADHVRSGPDERGKGLLVLHADVRNVAAEVSGAGVQPVRDRCVEAVPQPDDYGRRALGKAAAAATHEGEPELLSNGHYHSAGQQLPTAAEHRIAGGPEDGDPAGLRVVFRADAGPAAGCAVPGQRGIPEVTVGESEPDGIADVSQRAGGGEPAGGDYEFDVRFVEAAEPVRAAVVGVDRQEPGPQHDGDVEPGARARL